MRPPNRNRDGLSTKRSRRGRRTRRSTSLTGGAAAPVPGSAPETDHLLGTHAAAAFFGVAPRTLYKWDSHGDRLYVAR